MRRIEKKLWPDYFDRVIDGSKTSELRLGDFEIEQGDVLVLREWDPRTGAYTGREVERTVGFVSRWKLDSLYDLWTREDVEKHGLQTISLMAPD